MLMEYLDRDALSGMEESFLQPKSSDKFPFANHHPNGKYGPKKLV